MTLALHTHGRITAPLRNQIVKVLTLAEAVATDLLPEKIAVDLRNEDAVVDLDSLEELKFAGVLLAETPVQSTAVPALHSLRDPAVIAPGDVIKVVPPGKVSVLFRRVSNANSLFVTERCNSFCLMCSQPPRDENDDWRIAELLELVPLIDRSLPFLGVTGGEPTLLGEDLRRVLEAAIGALPATQLHVLTNGRRFAEPTFVRRFDSVRDRTTWAVPLYADTSDRHDYVVQARGAFDETIAGLYNLAERHHRIEIRFVLHAQTVPRLEAFVEFLWRSAPFVSHVALMGLEPMGFAKQNRDLLWIDPADYAMPLTRAIRFLNDRGISASIYNVPLCTLPRPAWPFARQSISDWKNMFAEECEACEMKVDCSGFFRSAGREWRSRNIHPIKRAVLP